MKTLGANIFAPDLTRLLVLRRKNKKCINGELCKYLTAC